MTNQSLDEQHLKIIQQTFPNGIVAFDLETTGLSPMLDKIIEIGAVKVDQAGNLTKFESLVHPQIPIPQNTIDIHHITDVMVENAPKLDSVLPQFFEFVGGLPLIAHNASFDIGFVVLGSHKLNLKLPSSDVFDSVKLARKCLNGPVNYKLDTLSSFYNFNREARHRAFDDSLACLMIFCKCLESLISDNKHSRYQDISKLYNLSDFSQANDFEIPDRLLPLVEVVSTKTIIEITYAGGSQKGKFRPVRPIGILPLPKGAVLHAQCLLSGHYKSFFLRKIKKILLIDEDKQDYWLERIKKLVGKHEP